MPSPTAPRVALVKWGPADGNADAIGAELRSLGHPVIYFEYDQPVPQPADIVLTFAPHNRWWPIARQVGARVPRPRLIHWNFEGVPDPRLTRPVIAWLGWARSWLGEVRHGPSPGGRWLAALPPLAWVTRRLHKFRYVGDSLRALRRGWLSVQADVSERHAAFYQRLGVPARFVPWGTPPTWHADLKLERDIDVLWMGKRRDGRRSATIDMVRAALQLRGVEMYVADGVERPFIFGDERTRVLNRTKLVLNIKTSAQISGFTFRFHTVAGNRALVVSEPFESHVSRYRAGEHYAVAPPEQLAEKILYLLAHEEERRALAENAYRLVTTEMTLRESVRKLLAEGE